MAIAILMVLVIFRLVRTIRGDGYISIKATIVVGGTSITHTVVYPILPTAPLADRDNDGVPEDVSIDFESRSHHFDNALLSNTSEIATIAVQSGYRVTLGNIARRNNHGQAQLGRIENDPILRT